MYSGNRIALLIPARNEALSLPVVLASIPREIDSVLVIDNDSQDATACVVRQHGACLVEAPGRGYGLACLAGIAVLRDNPPDIIAFADGDGSDDVSRLLELIAPIAEGEADLVIERRLPSHAGALSLPQRFGNRLATMLIHLIWRRRFADLGPMRAISWKRLQELEMEDQDFGWTIEMQIKALKKGLLIKECPLPYRARLAGKSKISRTLSGVLRAGAKILWIILREAASSRRIRKVSAPARS